jgi:ABC-type lipoprotein release transport system permease subunit
MFLKLAWRNIWRNRVRTGITVGAILLFVPVAVLTRSLQLGMYDHMIDNVVRTYAGYVQVHQKGYWEERTLNHSMKASDSLIQELQGMEEVQVAAPRLEGFALASHQDLTKGVRVVGIWPDKEKQLMELGDRLVEGEIPKGRGIMVGKDLPNYFGIGLGDTLVFLGQGFHGMQAAGAYPIRGVLDLNSPELNKRLAFLPMKEAQYFYGTGARWTSISLGVRSNADASVLASGIRGRLDTNSYEVMGWRELMPELVQTIQADNAGGVVMVLILYMIIAFGIFGTVLMMTEERMTEFGILVAVGMKRWRLSIVILLETIMLSMIGVLFGILLSYPLMIHFNMNPVQLSGSAGQAMKEFGFDPVIPTSTDPAILMTHAGIILVMAILSSGYPLARILRLKAVEAMRK